MFKMRKFYGSFLITLDNQKQPKCPPAGKWLVQRTGSLKEILLSFLKRANLWYKNKDNPHNDDEKLNMNNIVQYDSTYMKVNTRKNKSNDERSQNSGYLWREGLLVGCKWAELSILDARELFF